jgi:hypothetical protein
MPVLLFLEGRGKDNAGRSIEQVLAFDEVALERNHDFIQWLFALPERSRSQPQSPILTDEEIAAVRNSSVASDNLERATLLMSEFYRRNDHWLRAHDHNHLRITRIIRSLNLLRGAARARQFLDLIEERVAAAGNPVSSESRKYWRRALVPDDRLP